MRSTEPLVAVDALTESYPVSRRQIHRWLGYGCPSRLIRRRRLYKLSAVEKWLEKYNTGDLSAWRPPDDGTIEPMLTVKGFLRHYPISRRQLYRWMADGCPSRRVGHTRMFRTSAVEAWLTQFNQGNWAEAQAA